MTASSNILILTSDTGGGHRSAAKALEESLTRLAPAGISISTTQVLEEAHVVTRLFADFYNYLLRNNQDGVKYYYQFIQLLRLNESRLLFNAAGKYGFGLMNRLYPSILVSVHPMTQHFFAFLLKKLRLQNEVPLVTVVTDPCYGFWRGWACRDVQEYFVAGEDARRQLVDYGIPETRIRVVGMPVHRRFHPVSAEARRKYRVELGLAPDRFTVFLNSGFMGGGNIPRIFEALCRADLDIQAVFLAGRNERLMAEAREIADQAAFHVRLLGFSDEIHKLMNASDVMVSKLGGLTTFEALASQLPIIADVVTPPMPQERETAFFLERSGAGVLLDQPEKIVSVVKSLIESPERFEAMRAAALRHGKPGASDIIARNVLGYIPTGEYISKVACS